MSNWLRLAGLLALAGVLFAGTQVDTKQTTHNVPVSKDGAVMTVAASGPAGDLPPVGSRNPHTLDEVIISQDFEAIADNQLPAGWTQVDVDQGFCGQFNSNSVWRVYNYGTNAHSGSKVVMNHYNTDASPNNDWLILPQQVNLTAPITLSYWVASQDVNYLENYALKVSTTGTAPADFTNVIYTGTNVPVAWAQQTHDLSAFAGQSFYIAFHYTSVDEFVLKVDDVLLEAGAAGPSGSITGTITDDVTNNPITGATVLVGASLQATTDNTGYYIFTSVPVGTYTVRATHANYFPDSLTNVQVTDSGTAQADIALTPRPGQQIINENFDTIADNQLPTGWTQVDVDQGFCGQFSSNSIWRVYTYGTNAHSGTKVAMNHYNTDASPNNDWMILPQQSLAGTITLSYWVASQDANYLENYAVKVSTTGAAPADFTNVIYTGTNVPAVWTQQTHDLSAFAQQEFYIAFHYTSTDEFVLKIDDLTLEGEPWSAADDLPQVLPAAYAFDGNYPNPFNARTHFRFAVPQPGLVQIVLYNVAGQEAARIADGVYNAGSHSVAFDASALTSGVYFARLTAGNFNAAHKVLLLK